MLSLLRSLPLSLGGAASSRSCSCGFSASFFPAALRSAQLALPPGVFPFAVRCLGHEELARRKVGDLVILDVPQLDDLRPAVRSLA